MLRVLQERLLETKGKYFPVYIDLRAYKPMLIINSKKNKIVAILKKFNRHFDGDSFTKMGEVAFKINELKKVATSLKLTKIPEFLGERN